MSKILVQDCGHGDPYTLAVQYNPVCIVLDINLDLHRASETEVCDVRVKEEAVVKRNDVPKIKKISNSIKEVPQYSCQFPDF